MSDPGHTTHILAPTSADDPRAATTAKSVKPTADGSDEYTLYYVAIALIVGLVIGLYFGMQIGHAKALRGISEYHEANPE